MNKNIKVQDLSKKKICPFCQHNNYLEKYRGHLEKDHRDIIQKRIWIKNMMKHLQLDAEDLEKVKQLMIQLKKERDSISH